MSDQKLHDIFRTAAPQGTTHVEFRIATNFMRSGIADAQVRWIKHTNDGNTAKWFMWRAEEDGWYGQWGDLKRALPNSVTVEEFTKELIEISPAQAKAPT